MKTPVLLCQYPHRENQHAPLVDCGKPATQRALRGRRREPIHYCDLHADLVKAHFTLTKINN